jgi:tetratricopeptide (TPR) repeat protein
MIRLRRLTIALALLVVLPTVASAQRDTRYTREASKFLGLAMTRSDEAQKADMYRQAMVHLREGMERDADNAKVWLLSGTVLAALGELQEADRAFTRAVQMHPAYAEEIASEREAAWIDAFNRGIGLMDERNYDEAIRVMEDAQLIYDQRPEALMNLGALYASRGENEKAIEALERAAEITHGPLFEQLDEEGQASWLRYRELAGVNVAQMAAATGVEAFQAEQYEQAADRFRRAAELNPQARDYWFNYVQAIWAQTSKLEDGLEAGGAPAEEAKQKLPPLYEQVEAAVLKTREMDPNSEILYLIEARTHRIRGEMATSEAAKDAGHQAALRVLEAHDRLAVTLDNLQIFNDGDGVAIAGELKNRKAAVDAPVRIQFTFVALDGSTIGQETVTVNAPAPDSTVEFSGRANVEGNFAGWRYTVLN